MINRLKALGSEWANIHFPGKEKNVVLFASPRGGSTWVMEMISSQPGYKICNEPFNVRSAYVSRHLGIDNYADLMNPANRDVYATYLNGIISNRLRGKNISIKHPNHRFITNKIVFKMIHAGMDRLEWLEDNFHSKIVILTRHPIPTSRSRKVFPLLELFDRTALREKFSDEQLRHIDKVRETGSHLEKGVTAWCIHFSIPFNSLRESWVLTSYEEAVVHSDEFVTYMIESMGFSRPDIIKKNMNRPSSSSDQSSSNRQKLLSDNANRRKLISDWRNKIDEAEEKDLMGILELFNLDVYVSGRDTVTEKYSILSK